MSFFGKKKDVDFKARLERKLYLARADPEPVFDLSECDLKAVPSGIYSLCKVLRKEYLYLQCNQLSRLQDGGNIYDLSLLVTLDLHSNKFVTLPHEICVLKNLRELDISHNLIKELPDGLCELTTLRKLDVSFNRLKTLPSSLGNLKQLLSLKAQSNKQLFRLPNSLGRLKNSLQLFEVDTEKLEHPPNIISVGGAAAILKYLAEVDKSSNCIGHEAIDDVNDDNNVICAKHQFFVAVEKGDDYIQDKLKKMEQKKEERIKELIAIEKELQEQKKKEFELQKKNKEEKDKLLGDILEHESTLHNRLIKLQIKKDAEKSKLIESLQEVEEESDRLLEKVLEVSQRLRNPTLLQELDRTRREEMLSLQTQQLRRKEVLDAMDRILAEELECNDKLLNYKHSRDSSLRDNLQRLEEMENILTKTVNNEKNVGSRGTKWLAQLKKSVGKQGMALGIFLEKTDVQSQALLSEVALVQQQLAVLTSVELQRKQLDADQRLNELSCRRIALSELLVDLVNQQDERRKQLLQTLVDVKQKKMLQNEVNDDFWLQQYQQLMDRCPESLVSAQRLLDPLLVHSLVQANATHCLPYLASCSELDINSEKLQKMGMSEDDISAVIYAVKIYKEEKLKHLTPSAPLMEDEPGPSAPPENLIHLDMKSKEVKEFEYSVCVVCLDMQYQVVFIPCGHLCVCINCSMQIMDCPLCRVKISQKIHVIVP